VCSVVKTILAPYGKVSELRSPAAMIAMAEISDLGLHPLIDSRGHLELEKNKWGRKLSDPAPNPQ